MKFQVITALPQILQGLTEYGVVGQAIKQKLVEVECINPRAYTTDLHKTIDDRPFGGGDGMVLLCEPIARALDDLKSQNRLGHVIYLSPQGQTWNIERTQTLALKLRENGPITLICGRYGGIDQRIIETYVDEEISVGDYILSGGEIAAMAVIDSTIRTLPGVLGHADSAQNESFSLGYLEAPLFTRPRAFRDMPVPEVLLSGHHARIEEFKKAIGLLRTMLRRPDLMSDKLRQELPEARRIAETLSDGELRACGLNRAQIKEL